jgi:hypothetical protein
MRKTQKQTDLFVEYTLGELEHHLHRLVEDRASRNPSQVEELRSVEQDILKISTALGGEILPPPGLMANVADMLPDRAAAAPRRTYRTIYMGGIVATAIAVIAFILNASLPKITPIEALNLADAAIPSMHLTGSDTGIARQLTAQTGVAIDPLVISQQDGFEGGCCIALGHTELPAMLYKLHGTRVVLFELQANQLRTTGMKPMEMKGRKFFCCSHNGGAVVAVIRGHRAYVFTGKTEESSLAMLALGAVA